VNYDREILRLALPALGALAAEPLYVLVDTAIVGHLGTTQLAALAIAAAVMTSAFTIFNFLTYGTTARVARLHGAGLEDGAARVGSQAMWLGLFVGLLLSLFSAGSGLAPILIGLISGVAFGVASAAFRYGATRGQRDFVSQSQLVASRYDVLSPPRHAEAGRDLLAAFAMTA
jgi:Na+-driven multidrug efflux pump